MSGTLHTPGPWRWELSPENRSVHLVGGCPRFDLTVMDFARWGMNRAAPRFREPSEPGLMLMHRVCDRPDWVAPEPGRAHHASWHLLVTHPDARLIECAPDLLEALQRLDARGWFKESTCADQATSQDMAFARAVLAKAKGQQGGAA